MINKILLVNTYYYPNGKGGAELSTKILAECLAQNGFDVSVITTSTHQYMDVINGVDVHYMDVGNIYWLPDSKSHSMWKRILWHIVDSFGLNNLRNFDKKLTKINPDIVITSNLVQFSSKLWRVVHNRKIPIVHIIRDHYQMSISATMTNNMCFFKKWIFCKLTSIRKRKLSSFVNVVVGISEYILRIHLKNDYFTSSGIQAVIHNPLSNDERNIVTKKKRRPIFGYVGALNSRKGVDLILHEFSGGEIENELLIFGDGEEHYVKRVVETSLDHENIKYFGYEKPENIYNKIDYLIVPSIINEAFGRVIIEAYSYGVPVIGSNRGGIPELIEEYKTGFIFDPDVKGSLASVIKENSLNQRVDDSFFTKCIEKSKSFHQNEVLLKYLDIFEKLEIHVKETLYK